MCFYASWSLCHPAHDVSPIHWSDYTRYSECGHTEGVPKAFDAARDSLGELKRFCNLCNLKGNGNTANDPHYPVKQRSVREPVKLNLHVSVIQWWTVTKYFHLIICTLLIYLFFERKLLLHFQSIILYLLFCYISQKHVILCYF